MKPIVLALQYWAGDRDRAMALAEHASAARVGRSPNTFVFVNRFDCEPPPKTLLAKMRRKYAHVHSIPGTTRLTGHPDGCWGLWKDTIAWFRANGLGYSAILTFEADCTPLWPDFDERLQIAWESLPAEVFMAGHHWVGSRAPWGDHVNGNCMIRFDATKLDEVCALILPTGKPWDLYFYPVFQSLGVSNLPAIRSLYGTNFQSDFFDILRSGGAALQHGDKDGSLQAIARKYYGSVAGFTIRVKTVPPSDGVPGHPCEYPDEVPHLEAQLPAGSSALEIRPEPVADEVPGETYMRFNGSACPNGSSGFSFVYRRQWIPGGSDMKAWKSDLVWVDGFSPGTGVLSGPGKVLVLPGRPDSTLTHFEDPRIVPGPAPDRLRLSYARAAYSPDLYPGVDQTSVIVDRHGTLLGPPETLVTGENTTPNAGEKNWGFLPGSASFVYRLHPRVEIHDPEKSLWLIRDSTQAFAEWAHQNGQPRGGTPPLYVPELRGWVSMFQSHTPHPTRKRRYNAGFVLLSADLKTGRPGPEVLAVSRVPVLRGSARNGFRWAAGSRTWEPLVIFPTSLFRVGSDFFVTVGVNDCRMLVLRFPLAAVVESLGFNR